MLLFRLHLKTGQVAFAYVLVQHKDSRQRGVRLLLLRCVVRVMSDWYEQNEERLPLPPVLPLVLFQGSGWWLDSREFSDMFDELPEPLRSYVPSFRHAFIGETPRLDYGDLRMEVCLRAFFKVLKNGRRADLRCRYEKGIAKGEQRGILIGMVEGEARGEAKALIRLLNKRFGNIPDSVRERIFASATAHIEVWSERAFDAPDLDSVFGAN